MKKARLTILLLISLCHLLVSRTNHQIEALTNQQQQYGVGSTNSSGVGLQSGPLPGLSERAVNGLNSRYLSASGTASLAAATVAAAGANQANGQQASAAALQREQQILAQHAQAAAAAAASSNNQHQQQQAQQSQANVQQQQLGGGTTSNAAALQQQQQQQAVQQASGASQFLSSTQQQQQAQQQLGLPTPVMSTTYAYNPQSGQLIPSELSASALLGPQQHQLQQQFGLAQSFGRPQVARLPAQFPFATVSRPVGNAFNGFTRRQGAAHRPAAPGQTFVGGQFGAAGNQIDDDSNGLFQQQQVSSAQGLSLADQLAATFGLDPANFGAPTALLNQNNGGYSLPGGQSPSVFGYGTQQLADQQQQQQQQQLGLLPTPTTNFGNFAAASSTSNQQQQQQPDYIAAAHGSSFVSQRAMDSQCVAADGRHGTCYQASECIKRGGTPMGRCGSSGPNAQQSGADLLTGSSHVCCLFDVTCGQFAAERFVYFRNPNYPNTFDQSRMCRAKIGKLDKGVCQFRLDLLRFDIGKPTNGNCSQDMFVVSGQNENYVIPKICGLNDDQHYYVGVDESGVITLHMMMMGYAYRRSFEILITQIPCRSDFAAPAHCLQYFMGTHGTIKSFNYEDNNYSALAFNRQPANQVAGVVYGFESLDGSGGAGATGAQFASAQQAPYGIQFSSSNGQLQARQQQHQSGFAGQLANRFGTGPEYNLGPIQFGGYPNDLDYTICIRKESGFCSITYALSRSDQSGQLSPFAVGANSFLGGGGGVANDSWHAGGSLSTECRDDYLLVGGVRLCSGPASGGGLAGGLYDQQQQLFGNFSLANSNLNGQNGNVQLLQQQLQQQHNYLVQQLARLQQQQAAQTGNNSAASQLNGSGNSNLEQQQAALLQQLMVTQQQLSALAANNQLSSRQQLLDQASFGLGGMPPIPSTDTSGSTIITDTTSGPFFLRFVSNMARNARGFQIDYRQNPCK